MLPPTTASIFCEIKGERYRLEFPVASILETFDSEEAAVMRAQALVVEETTLVIYGTDGARLVVATLFPMT